MALYDVTQSCVTLVTLHTRLFLSSFLFRLFPFQLLLSFLLFLFLYTAYLSLYVLILSPSPLLTYSYFLLIFIHFQSLLLPLSPYFLYIRLFVHPLRTLQSSVYHDPTFSYLNLSSKSLSSVTARCPDRQQNLQIIIIIIIIIITTASNTV